MQADVFIGKISKDFNVKPGFKGELQLADKIIYIACGFDGKTTDFLKQSLGKTVALIGDLRFPQKDSKAKLPILEVKNHIKCDGLMIKRGRLTRDAELAYTKDGKQYAKFSIAAQYGYGDRKQTDFINCQIWGNEKEKNPAITLAENGNKGREIIVVGNLKINEKDDKTYYNCSVRHYEFIGSKPSPKSGQSQEEAINNQNGSKEIDLQDIEFDDDIPF
jgi:single-strand DNA-binding protein